MDLTAGIDIQQAVVDFQWQVYDPDREVGLDPEFWALSLCGEAGEVAEWHKKRWRDRAEGRSNEASPGEETLRSELGDVMICLTLLAEADGLDLAEVTLDKLEEIRRRIGEGKQGVKQSQEQHDD